MRTPHGPTSDPPHATLADTIDMDRGAVGIRENVSKLETNKLRRNYRLHMTFVVIFAIVLIFSIFVQQRLPIDAVLWLVIVIGNGYGAYVTKQKLDSRSDIAG